VSVARQAEKPKLPPGSAFDTSRLKELPQENATWEAVQAGVTSIGLEYKGRELMVFHQTGPVGLGAGRIPQELQQEVIAALVKRAGLSRKSRGKMQLRLLGRDYEAVVEVYDSFGESAFTIALKERTK
jgi:hypothetical protein